MEQKIWILFGIIIVILVIVIGLIIYFGSKCNKKRVFERFDEKNITHSIPAGVLEYAKEDDPYDKPFVINNLITPASRRAIINYARNHLTDSQVLGGKIKGIRNSQQCWISKHDSIIKPIYEKISKQFNIPIENAEDLQVVRYMPGQYYNEHHDACCDNIDKCKEFTKLGGQRKLTVLVYLNDEFTDGETEFKNLGIKIKPNAGDAIVFYPLARNSSKCHPHALHAGLPVSSGEKWIANLWFREGPYIRSD